MDFYILTVRSSGSHMLASALDSHPDIDCIGEVWRDKPLYDWLGSGGKVHGGILWPGGISGIPASTKMICLTRDYCDRYRSRLRTSALGKQHALEPAIIKYQEPEITESMLAYRDVQNAAILAAAKRFPHIVIDYDDITGGHDIREIPEAVGTRLCEFLGVNYQTMTPKFYKPQRAA